MTHDNLFRNKYALRGSDWLRQLPEEDRLVFSRLGHMALRARGIPLQSLGGQARVSARCPECGKFQSSTQPHDHPPSYGSVPRDKRQPDTEEFPF